jgi:hypothetical protein
MRCVFYVLCFSLLPFIGHSQNFKYIQPKLTDSTEVVKAEIDSISGSEYIYYIDYSKNSEHKKMLVSFGSNNGYQNEEINNQYWNALKNIKEPPKKFNIDIPKQWVQLFKYKGNWVLFDDIPKFELRDSCFISFEIENVVYFLKDYKIKDNKIHLTFYLNYLFDRNIYIELKPTIKFLDKEKQITLWRFEFDDGELYYLIMLPTNQVMNYPIMVLESSELLSDETDIFDKIDYEKLWND